MPALIRQDQKLKIKDQNQAKSPKLEVRYRAFYLSIRVIKFIAPFPHSGPLRIIFDQLVRCITSKREFAHYFQIALKSANEAKYWLAMVRELLPERSDELNAFIKEVDEIARIIATSILTMKGKRSL